MFLGGSYHNYKRCNYIGNRYKKYLNLLGGPLPLGKARAYEKKDGIDCLKAVIN